MSFIIKFIAAVGEFFSGLFHSAEDAFNDLSELEQKVSKQASGIVAIINANLDKTPNFILAILQEKYPGISKDLIKDALVKVGKVLCILDNLFDGSLEDAIGKIQNYLNNLEGHNTWVTISKTIVAIIADILAPGTVIQKIELVLEYVYLTFIKGKMA